MIQKKHTEQKKRFEHERIYQKFEVAHARKALGQNFLRSEGAVRELVSSARINENDVVLEVGPGTGAITKVLLTHAKKVVAVEKDKELVDFLEKEFEEEIKNGKLEVVHDDILLFNPESRGLSASEYKLVGAIPYYITGAFLRRTLESRVYPQTIALIIQKEVAERIVAKKTKPFGSARGKESILSISIKVYGEPRYVKTVKAGSFYPRPNVDSAIFVIENISKDFFSNISHETFFALLKAGFGNKRKMLAPNLKKLTKKISKKLLSSLGIKKTARAEDLTLPQWKKLCHALFGERRA